MALCRPRSDVISRMLRLRRSRLAALLCVSLWGVTVPLRAQPAAPPAAPAGGEAAGENDEQNVDQARQLFAEGLDFVEHEDWVNAEDRFRRVLALRSSHVVTYNLASALMHLGRLVESSELLRSVVRDPSADATTHDAATQLLSEIRAAHRQPHRAHFRRRHRHRAAGR